MQGFYVHSYVKLKTLHLNSIKALKVAQKVKVLWLPTLFVNEIGSTFWDYVNFTKESDNIHNKYWTKNANGTEALQVVIEKKIFSTQWKKKVF